MSDRITCPGCGRNVLIRKNGAIQNHGVLRSRTATECRWSGRAKPQHPPQPEKPT